MRGKDLTEWIAWTERFQNLKAMDSAYGYTNLAGDKVNLDQFVISIVKDTTKG
jgi:hypothetical protein